MQVSKEESLWLNKGIFHIYNWHQKRLYHLKNHNKRMVDQVWYIILSITLIHPNHM